MSQGGCKLSLYEPTLEGVEFFGSEVIHVLGGFKASCGTIIANRWSDELSDVADKVYTRDLFKRDLRERWLRLFLTLL